ncbi:unnamed protein product [Closterium sp. NIES-53]
MSPHVSHPSQATQPKWPLFSHLSSHLSSCNPNPLATPFLPLAGIRSRPDGVAPSQARHVFPNMATPPHPPLDSRTAEAELALADVTSADMAFLRLEGVFAAFGEERVWSAPIAQWPAASSRYCYRSFLLGGEKREGVVGCG